VIARRASSAQNLGPENGRNDRHPTFELGTNGRREEGRDDVVVTTRQLGLHEGARGAIVGVDTSRNLLRMFALVDDLLVVDGDDGKVEASREKIGVRVEVGEHDLGLEVADVLDVGGRILEEHRRG
jgi:hypothetical protein